MTATGVILIVVGCYGLLTLIVGPILRRRIQRETDAAIQGHEDYRRWYRANIEGQ